MRVQDRQFPFLVWCVVKGMKFNLVKISLSKLLSEYRNMRPNLSLRSLSRNIGVNRYFLAKILDGNEKVKFCIDEILIFCKFMKNNLPDNPLVNKELSAIQNFFSEHLGSSEIKLIDHDKTNDIDLYDRYNFFILILACCDWGFTKDKIVSILGENCLGNMKDLLETGHIELTDSGKIRIKDGAPLIFSNAVGVHHLGDLLKFYRLSHREQNRNFLNMKIQSVSKEALEKVVELQRNCDRRIYELMVDEKNLGPNPIFSLNCVDTFTDELV